MILTGRALAGREGTGRCKHCSQMHSISSSRISAIIAISATHFLKWSLVLGEGRAPIGWAAGEFGQLRWFRYWNRRIEEPKPRGRPVRRQAAGTAARGRPRPFGFRIDDA